MTVTIMLPLHCPDTNAICHKFQLYICHCTYPVLIISTLSLFA